MKIVMHRGDMLRVQLTNGKSMLISDDGKTSTMPTEWDDYVNEEVKQELEREPYATQDQLMAGPHSLKDWRNPRAPLTRQPGPWPRVRGRQSMDIPVTLTEEGERYFGVKPPAETDSRDPMDGAIEGCEYPKDSPQD